MDLPTDYQDILKGAGYSCVRKLTNEETAFNEKVQKDVEKRLSCFVPCNAKATNIYGDRRALAYCFNIFHKPMITGFFIDHNPERLQSGLPEVSVDEKLFFLCCPITGHGRVYTPGFANGVTTAFWKQSFAR